MISYNLNQRDSFSVNSVQAVLLDNAEITTLKKLNDDQLGVFVLFGYPMQVRKRIEVYRRKMRERQIEKNVVFLHGAYTETSCIPLYEKFLEYIRTENPKTGFNMILSGE